MTRLPNLFTVGEWRVQPQHNQITTSTQEIRIEPKAMRVLVCLASHPGEVVTKGQLIEEVWEGAFVTDEALTYAIWELRKALGDDAKKPRFIQTVPKQGYCLIAPVSIQSAGEKKSRWIWLAAGAVGLVAALLVMWEIRSPPPTSVSAKVIAVLPFEVHGSEAISYLGEGMVDLLSMKLEGAGDLHSVDARALMSVITRRQTSLGPEEGRQIAKQFGAGFFVLGSVVETGDTLQLNASLYSSNGDLQARAESVAEDEQRIPERVDDLTVQLLSSYLGVAGHELDHMVSRSTRSLPALKLYLDAQSAYRDNAYAESKDLLLKAVEIDPSFALGWYRLSYAALTDFDYQLGIGAAEKALELSNQLSNLDQLRVQASYAAAKGEPDEAERLFRTILGIYPEDVDALEQLSGVLLWYNWRHARPADEAREPCERVLAMDPENFECLWNLGAVAVSQRRWDEAQSFIDRRAPETVEAWSRVLPLFALGDSTAKEQFIADLERDNEVSLCGAIGALPNLSIEETYRLVPLLIAPGRLRDARTVGHILRAYLEAAMGRWRLANESFAEAERLNHAHGLEYRALAAVHPFLRVPRDELESLRQALATWDAEAVLDSASPPELGWMKVHVGFHAHIRLYLLGILHARLGDTTAAYRFAEELESLQGPPDAGTVAQDHAHGLRAHIAWTRGLPTEALGELQKTRRQGPWLESRYWWTSPFLFQSHDRFLTAMALQELGRNEEAIAWYDSLRRLISYSFVYQAPVHFRRAEIYESLGQTEKAIEHYRRFIDLWKDCDPPLRPRVEEARRRLERLQKSFP